MNRFEFYSNVQKYEKNKLNHSTFGDKAKGYMQDKHLYYKRIGNPGNYKYFYTKEEYDNHIKSQSNKSGAAAEAEREAAKRERYNDYKKTMNELGYSDADVIKNITKLSQNKWAKEAEKVKEASEKLKKIKEEKDEQMHKYASENLDLINKNFNDDKMVDYYKMLVGNYGYMQDPVQLDKDLMEKLGKNYTMKNGKIEYKNEVMDRTKSMLIKQMDNTRDPLEQQRIYNIICKLEWEKNKIKNMAIINALTELNKDPKFVNYKIDNSDYMNNIKNSEYGTSNYLNKLLYTRTFDDNTTLWEDVITENILTEDTLWEDVITEEELKEKILEEIKK